MNELTGPLTVQMARWQKRIQSIQEERLRLSEEEQEIKHYMEAARVLLGIGVDSATAIPKTNPESNGRGRWDGVGIAEAVIGLRRDHPAWDSKAAYKELVSSGYPFKNPSRAAQAVGLCFVRKPFQFQNRKKRKS